jgi:hypothetical protein
MSLVELHVGEKLELGPAARRYVLVKQQAHADAITCWSGNNGDPSWSILPMTRQATDRNNRMC